jgi:phosphate starvation-inducible PhoH-like protein
MRGVTFQNQVALLDESQNCTYGELKLFVSRMGRGSKLLLTGDLDQTDITPTISGYDCDLDAFIDDIHKVKGVELVEFKDSENLRDPLLVELLQRMR